MSNLDRRPPARELGGLEGTAAGPVLDLLPGKEVLLGESTRVRRLLPTMGRRLVGAWAVVDHYGPDDITSSPGMQVPPHPHTGLQTVSRLLDGEVHHRDSLGSDARIHPGELALMTAGHGIAHSEQSPAVHPRYLHGAQLWVALPEAARDTAPAFAHHTGLPGFTSDGLTATVLMGSLGGATSAGPRAPPAGGRRPRPGRRCRRRAAAGAGLRVRPAGLVRDGRGGGRPAGGGRDAVPRHRRALGAGACRGGDPAAAARRRAVRGADRHVVELRRPLRGGDRRVRRAVERRGRALRHRRRLRRRPAGGPAAAAGPAQGPRPATLRGTGATTGRAIPPRG